MITSTRGVSGSEHPIERSPVRQGSPRPLVRPVGSPGAPRVLVGLPRPMPETQPSGDPCALTLWGTEEKAES